VLLISVGAYVLLRVAQLVQYSLVTNNRVLNIGRRIRFAAGISVGTGYTSNRAFVL